MLGVECDQTSCVGTRVRHVCHHVTSTRCRGRVAAVACTVPCTVLYCGQGDVTALPRIARQCHVATPRSPPRCQPHQPRWSSLLARLVSRLELYHVPLFEPKRHWIWININHQCKMDFSHKKRFNSPFALERYNAVYTDQCFPPGPGLAGGVVWWCVGGDGWWEQRQHTCEIVTRGYYTESSPINSLDRR